VTALRKRRNGQSQDQEARENCVFVAPHCWASGD
jgi:hypothetical protein